LAFASLIVAALVAALVAPIELVYLLAFALVIALGTALAKRRALLLGTAPVLVGFLVLAGLSTLPTVFRFRPSEEVDARAAQLARSDGGSEPEQLIIVSGMGVPTATFYSNRPVVRVRQADDLEDFTRGRSVSDVIVHREDLRRLRSQYDVEVLGQEQSLIYARIRHQD
jgi:hypothetical protein